MRCLPFLLALVTGCTGKLKLDPKTPYAVVEAPREVRLTEDLTTRAVLTTPAHKSAGPYPTVVLVGGEGPADRDGTLQTPTGTTPMFALLARDLTARGFAVVRYDKRHVAGPGKVDLPKFIADRDQAVFRDDLLAVLEWTRRDPAVDPDRLFLVGFDEGAIVATSAATRTPLAGLVLLGAPGMPFRERFQGWLEDLTLPYLERFAYNGFLDGRILAMALHTAVAEPVLSTTGMLAVSFTRKSPVVTPSPLVDRDRDGILSIDGEIEPSIPVLVDFALGPLGPWGYLTVDRALPPIPEIVGDLALPILVLHGANDAYTPPRNADRIQAMASGSADLTVGLLPGLGHALGPASEPLDDLNRPMTSGARDTLADWLVERAAR